jgi:CRP/FNR family transcriptional regulator, cyclic AMP receptor protein
MVMVYNEVVLPSNKSIDQNFGMKTDSFNLKTIPLLANLSILTQAEVNKCLFQEKIKAGTILFIEEEPCQAVYFIAAGVMRIFRIGIDGREQVLASLEPGEVFNTVPPLLMTCKNQASTRAETDVVLYGLTVIDFLNLIQCCPDFAIMVLRDFAARLSHLNNLVEGLSLHSVRGRLAKFLLKEAQANEIQAKWTQDEIAEHLGSVRDVVGRTLRVFIDAGYIRKERQKILIMDRKGLEKEAES